MSRPQLTKDQYIERLLRINRALKANVKGLEHKVINAEKMYHATQNEFNLYRQYTRDAEWEAQELRILKAALTEAGIDYNQLIRDAAKKNDTFIGALLDRARGLFRGKVAA